MQEYGCYQCYPELINHRGPCIYRICEEHSTMSPAEEMIKSVYPNVCYKEGPSLIIIQGNNVTIHAS